MILVFVEHDGGRPERSSLEAVTVGRGLAERLGCRSRPSWSGARCGGRGGARGLRRLSRARGRRPGSTTTRPRPGHGAWSRWPGRMDRTRSWPPGATAATRCWPTSAARLGQPLAANCIEIEPGEPFRLTRQRWGGSLLEEATLDGPVRFLTVAEHVVEPAAATEPTSLAVQRVRVDVTDADLRSRVVRRRGARRRRQDLAGRCPRRRRRRRGVGSAEGVRQLEELAGLLGGRGRRLARGDERGLAAARRAGRPDRGRGSRPTCTSPAGSAGRSSTSSAARPPSGSWPSTRIGTRRSWPARRTR